MLLQNLRRSSLQLWLRSTMGPSGTQLWHNESWTNETRSQNITIRTHLNESKGGYFKIPELKYRCVHLHGSNSTKSYHYTLFLMRNFVAWRNQWPIFNTVIHHVTIMIFQLWLWLLIIEIVGYKTTLFLIYDNKTFV